MPLRTLVHKLKQLGIRRDKSGYVVDPAAITLSDDEG